MAQTQKKAGMYHVAVAFFTGGILATMTQINGLLAFHGGGFFSSWVTHGVGAVVGFALMLILTALGKKSEMKIISRAPWWSYLGGVFGAITIVLMSISLIAGLSLAAALAFSLSGQVVTSLVLDKWGLFGLPKRELTNADYSSAALILVGSFIISFSGVRIPGSSGH